LVLDAERKKAMMRVVMKAVMHGFEIVLPVGETTALLSIMGLLVLIGDIVARCGPPS
jgi:hypothetical protein